MGTQELKCEGIPESSCDLAAADSLQQARSFCPSAHRHTCMRISEQRYCSERTTRKHCNDHGTGAVGYHGLCVVCRQLCLEAESWSPLGLNTVVKALEGCVSKLRERDTICKMLMARPRVSHTVWRGYALCPLLLLEREHLLRKIQWGSKSQRTEKYRKWKVS